MVDTVFRFELEPKNTFEQQIGNLISISHFLKLYTLFIAFHSLAHNLFQQ